MTHSSSTFVIQKQIKKIMTKAPFFQNAQTLYKKWLSNEQPETHFDNYFAMDALYEPYLLFPVNDTNNSSIDDLLKDPLFILTTNPGGVMDFQKPTNFRKFIQRYSSYSAEELSYQEIAFLLGKYYMNAPEIKNARARIQKMVYLAKKLNKTGVVQVEMIPFHSKDFKSNRKHLYAKNLEKDIFLNTYTTDLRNLLANVSVLSPQGWLNEKKNDWLPLIKKTMGLEETTYNGLKQSKGSDSIAFVSTQEPVIKGITLIKGSNNFPSVTYMDKMF